MRRDVIKAIESNEPESSTLEYKSSDAHRDDILRELVAFANNDGGTVIVGVREEDGEIVDVENINNPKELEEALQNKIASRVEPRVDIEFSEFEYRGKRIIGISVSSKDLLRSLSYNNKPCFPIRQGSTTTYLHGLDLARAYSGEGPDLSGLKSGNQGSDTEPNLTDIFRKVDASTNKEKVLIMIRYAETFESKESVSTGELKELFHEARVPLPANVSRTLHQLSNEDCVMTVDSDHPRRWALTIQGMDRAEMLLNPRI